MSKILKYLAIVFLLISACLVINEYYNALRLENSQFDIPDGFNLGNNNKNGDMTISNGSSTIYISKFKSDDLNKSINSYKDYCKKKGYDIEPSNLTLNNINVFKYTQLDSGAEHYWFTHDDIGYSIYTWKKVNNCDYVVSELINCLI